MKKGERVFRILLLAYPADFRRAFGEEMRVLFNDARRESRSPVRLWGDVVWDVARSASRLRLDALRSRDETYLKEGSMKPMAILAVLVGVFEALGGGAEALAGGRAGDGMSLLAGGLGLIAGAMLIAAGISLLRRLPKARLAGGAALIALVAMVAASFMGRLGIAAMAFGIVLPIALLLLMRMNSRRDPIAA